MEQEDKDKKQQWRKLFSCCSTFSLFFHECLPSRIFSFALFLAHLHTHTPTHTRPVCTLTRTPMRTHIPLLAGRCRRKHSYRTFCWSWLYYFHFLIIHYIKQTLMEQMWMRRSCLKLVLKPTWRWRVLAFATRAISLFRFAKSHLHQPNDFVHSKLVLDY